MGLPPVNQRIKDIINSNYNGNVRAFCIALGLSDSQKINRLFNIDKRNNKFPSPSIDILSLISNKLGISLNWLQSGDGEMQNTPDHPPIEIEPVSGGEINVSQLMNMMQKQMDMVNSVIEQNKQLLNKNDKLVAENEKLMRELMKLGKEERPAIEDFGSVEDRQ